MLAFGVPEMLVAANIDQAIVSLPSIRVNNTFRVHLSSDEAPECSAQTVGDHFVVIDPAIAFIDPEHGLLEHPSSPFSGTGSSPKPGRTKTCVHLDHAPKLLPFSTLVYLNHHPKGPEITIDGLSVQTQKYDVFVASMSMQKQAKNFFDPVGADFSILKHFFRPSGISDDLEPD